jgi:hypothetical protein
MGADEGNGGRERDRCNPTKPENTLATQNALPLTPTNAARERGQGRKLSFKTPR